MARYTALFLLVCVAVTIAQGVEEENKEAASKSAANRGGVASFARCYSCVSCPNVREETYVRDCPFSPNPVKAKTCLKYAEKLATPANGQNRSWVIRGCASDKGTCNELKAAYALNQDIKLDYCYECEGDKCNGASRSVSEMFFAFFTVILVPIFAKYAMS